MDEIKKEQIISAIYIAVSTQNYRCAQTIFDVTMMERINETLDKAIELTKGYGHKQLAERIQRLKYNV